MGTISSRILVINKQQAVAESLITDLLITLANRRFHWAACIIVPPILTPGFWLLAPLYLLFAIREASLPSFYLMNVSVRPARPEDLVALVHLLDEIAEFHYGEDPTQFREPATAEHSRYLEELFQDPDAAVFVAEDQGVLAGIAVAVIREAPPLLNPNRFVLLENLAVATEFRRTGVGRKLVDAAVLWTRARDIQELDLNVYEFNHSAIRFYEAIGFRTVSRRMKRTLAPLVETKR